MRIVLLYVYEHWKIRERKMRTIAVVSILFLAFSALTPVLSAEDAVELKLKFIPGNRYVNQMDLVMEQTMGMAGMPEPIKQSVTLSLKTALSVIRKSLMGGYELEMEFLACETKMEGGLKDLFKLMKGEEGNSKEDPMDSVANGLVGSKLKIFLNSDLEPEKIEGLNEIMAKAAPDTAGGGMGGINLDGLDLESLFGGAGGIDIGSLLSGLGGAGNALGGMGGLGGGNMLSAIMNEDTLARMCLDGMSSGLPGKPVKPGDTWTDSLNASASNMMSMKTKTTYTFTKWETRDGRRCAVIDYSGTVDVDSGGGGALPMSMKNGKLSGTIWFDPELGMTIENSGEQAFDMNMAIAIPIPGQEGGAQPMEMKMKQTSSVKLIEVTESGSGD